MLSSPNAELPTPSCNILLTGGGTGGHVYPLVALAQEFSQREPPPRFAWAGRADGIAAATAAAYGWDYHPLPVSPYRRGERFGLARAALRNVKGIVAARRLLKEVRFDLVIGSGGYVALPAYAAAWQRGVPFVILESNSVAGMANRVFAPYARVVFAAYHSSARCFGNDRVVVVDNPVRREFTQAAGPAPELAGWEEQKLLLVTGGSQGAASLNSFVAQEAENFLRDNPDWRVLLLCGKNAAPGLRRLADRIDGLRVVPFTQHMPALLRRSTLAVSRAGALTLAELLYGGVPAVLVPFPEATEDHQYHNAAALAARGQAVVLREAGDPRSTAAAIAAAVREVITAGGLEKMTAAARAAAGVNPAVAMVDAILEYSVADGN